MTIPTPTAPDTPPPLITSLHVTGFQSLHDISLTLAPFTVIVGPSSSGKSALTRALRTLTANARGTAYITTGHTRARISATLHDGTTVTLTRSPSTRPADNAYVLEHQGSAQLFTKLGGEVPAEIREALHLPEDTALTFAGQFDKPYLLDASPQEVARALASLTNVHVIFNASREASRTRLAQAATLRTRTTDLEVIRLRADEFRALAAQRTAQTLAETTLDRAHALAERIERLSSVIVFHDSAARAMAHHAPTAQTTVPTLTPAENIFRDIGTLSTHAYLLTNALGVMEVNRYTAITPVPDIGPVEAAQTRLSAYRAILVRLRTARTALTTHGNEHTQALIDWGNAQDAYVGALTALGTCPTCGQDTTAVDHDTLEKIHA